MSARAKELLASVGLQEFLTAILTSCPAACSSAPSSAARSIHDPPLILMDEPLGALDAMTREHLRGDLERLWMEKAQDCHLRHPQHR